MEMDAWSITARNGGNGRAYYLYARASTHENQVLRYSENTAFNTTRTCAKALLLAVFGFMFSLTISVAPAFADSQDVDSRNDRLSSSLYEETVAFVLTSQSEESSQLDDSIDALSSLALPEDGESSAELAAGSDSNVDMVALLGKDGELVIRTVQGGDAELAKLLNSPGNNDAPGKDDTGADKPAEGGGIDQPGNQASGNDSSNNAQPKDQKGESDGNSGSRNGSDPQENSSQDKPVQGGSGSGPLTAPTPSLVQSGDDDTAQQPSLHGFDLEALKKLVDNLEAVYVLGDGNISKGAHAPWYDKRGMIRSIAFGEGVCPSSMAYWFSDLVELKKVDFSGLDTSQVADMQQLFSDCWSLDSLDLKGFNTSNVKSMARMFSGCKKVSSLDLSGFNTSSVTSMSGMFAGAEALKTVNLTSFDTANVTDMSGMFSGCSSVKSLNLSSFKTTKLKSNDGMFSGCKSLAALDASGFTAEQLSAAAVPTDNDGGFWLMNVPGDFKANVVLREPSPEEKAAYIESPKNSDNRQNPDPEADPKKEEGQKNESNEQPTKPVPPKPSEQATPQLPVNNSGSAAVQQPVQSVDEQPSVQYSPSDSIVFINDEYTPTVQPPGATTSVTDQLPKVVINLVSPTGRSIDPGADLDEVAAAATSVLQTLGFGPAADKTLAMTIAALGMLIAAGLVLTLCFKIR